MGKNSGSILNLKGFDKLLEQIQEAGGNVDKATEQAINKSVDVVSQDLHNACNSAGVPSSISSEIKTDRAEWNGNVCSSRVGWKLGAYNPDNPSQGYKAIFLNYGTPRRKKHGKITARNFIATTKETSKKKLRKIQKETLDEILKGLPKK